MKVTSLSHRLDVSRKTIYRWKDKEVKKFDDKDLKTLANELKIRYEWLQFGRGQKYLRDKLNRIESAVNDTDADYKDPDQTVSDVVSKAKNLKQGLEGLIEDLEKLR